ncbi:MAG: CRISPR-associated endoribonuclease Cas6 [Bernardetiaceae bacterium]|nr:CRISPR-associated endoribonuclease Cas6 [Bernardetiaceae bacterium]
MIFNIKLRINQSDEAIIPINYQYELSSWIYRTMATANGEFSDFLHDHGYDFAGKRFKLFTFANLYIHQRHIERDRLHIHSPVVSFKIHFCMPPIAEHFIIGLFQAQEFNLGDRYSQAAFKVETVETCKPPEYQPRMIFKTNSPIVLTYSNEEGKDVYLSPITDSEIYETILFRNLKDKYKASQKIDVLPAELLDAPCHFELLSSPSDVRSRLVTLKAHTPQQTKVRGFQYRFALTAPQPLLEIALLAGVGRYNAMGFGAVEEMEG